MHRALVVGIGGQAGSGKSTVARHFARHGAEVVDADRIGWSLLACGTRTARRVVRAFGPRVLNRRGCIDRRKLGALVFSRRNALARLDSIVHPALLAELRRRLAARSAARVKVIDAALLFAWGWQQHTDLSILVTARRRNKLARMMKRGLTRARAADRLRSQLPEAVMRRQADIVLRNDSTPEALARASDAIWLLLGILRPGIMSGR